MNKMTTAETSRRTPESTKGTSPAAPSRGRGLAATAAWLLVTLFCLALLVVSLPTYYVRLTTVCIGAPCSPGQLRHDGARSLESIGLSITTYAISMTALVVAMVLVAYTLSVVVMWRQRGEVVAFVASIILVTFPTSTVAPSILSSEGGSGWRAAILAPLLISRLALPFFFYLFPSGRFVPSWTRWLVVLWIVVLVPFIFFPQWSFTASRHAVLLNALIDSGFIISWAYAQLYRYRHVADAAERQQTKWVVSGISMAMGAIVVYWLPVLLWPSFRQSGSLYSSLQVALYILCMLAIVLSVGFAILRYRLWDIDIIINRTLVYGALTVVLTLVYFSSVLLLQEFFQAVSGQRNSLAIVASTLGIAALFQPLLRRIQTLIDRRFYRRRYDAQKTLQAFSARLRDEVDLNVLAGDLLAAVEEAVQPAHVSLWLREGGGRARDSSLKSADHTP